jgi:hypothetical protein
MFLEHMGTNGEEINQEKDIGDLSVIWNMLYLKTIDKEIDLSKSRQDLRNIQWQLLVHRTTIESLKKYNTRVVGEISMKSVVKNSKESSTNIIIVAVVAGLIMSLFIAFFWEYIEESKARRKGK